MELDDEQDLELSADEAQLAELALLDMEPDEKLAQARLILARIDPDTDWSDDRTVSDILMVYAGGDLVDEADAENLSDDA